MILPINHVAEWRYIRQQKQAQIDKCVIRGNTTRIGHDCRVGDNVLTQTKSAFKYKTLYRGPYKIVQTWTNGTITLRMGAVTMRVNI